MSAMIVTELMKIVRRPITWVLAAVVFGGFVLLNTLIAIMIAGPQIPGVEFEDDTSQAEIRSSVVLPDGFADNLGTFGLLGSVTMIILAAGVVGSEFSWGTMRTVLQVQTNRAKVLLAKIVTLQIVTLALVLISIPLSILSAWVMGIAIDEPVSRGDWLTASFFAEMPVEVFRVFIAVGMWVLIATALTFITHSLTAGIAATLVLNFLGGTISNLISSLGDAGVWVSRLFPNEAINAVVSLNTSDPGLYDRSDYTWIVANLVLWSLLLTGAAIARFRRMNILAVSA